MDNKELQMGIIGAGNFAGFAAETFCKVPGIKLVAVTDKDNRSAQKLADKNDLQVYDTPANMLGIGEIDIVYIATPPLLHYSQSKMALLAGAHVICEKPAALEVSEAAELVALARSSGLLYAVNLMQRYNPLFEVVKKLINQKILGDFLHGFFENYASDEHLGYEHWFWNPEQSGGIFIEHGVHFFDLFAGWLGEGKVANALQLSRSGASKQIIDRVQATVLYAGGPVNFYHGFNQPDMLDRQEMRLQFELGEITLHGWIPTRMKLYGLLGKDGLARIREILPEMHILEDRRDLPKARGRFHDLVFEDLVSMEYRNALDKQALYRQMLCAMLSDQCAWIRNADHVRVIDDSNAVASLQMARDATLKAETFYSKHDAYKI